MKFLTKKLLYLLNYLTIQIVLVVSMFGAGFAETAGDSARFITWQYKNTDMGLYIPKSTNNKPIPVVMYLHYCTGTPVYPEFWIIPALNKIEPCAVFLPTAPPEGDCADWGGTYDQALRPNMVNALHEFDSLITIHGFDISRIYLYGESMGGEGVYRLLMDFPARYAGGVVASGYTVDKGGEQMAKTPLWIFHGSDDNLADVNNARTIYKSITDAGGTMVKYTEYEGYDHVSAMNKVHDEDSVLVWLLSKKRTTAISNRVHKHESISNAGLVCCKNGTLSFSHVVPSGAVLSLLSLNGEVIYQTVISTTTVSLPSVVRNRTVLWCISHKMLNASGRIVPVAR